MAPAGQARREARQPHLDQALGRIALRPVPVERIPNFTKLGSGIRLGRELVGGERRTQRIRKADDPSPVHPEGSRTDNDAVDVGAELRDCLRHRIVRY